MDENGQALVELVLVLPLLLWLIWIAFDLVIIFRDSYILDYTIFHTLRAVSVAENPSQYPAQAQAHSLLLLGLKGTSARYPTISKLEQNNDRLVLNARLLRKHESGIWPPVSTELSTMQE